MAYRMAPDHNQDYLHVGGVGDHCPATHVVVTGTVVPAHSTLVIVVEALGVVSPDLGRLGQAYHTPNMAGWDGFG